MFREGMQDDKEAHKAADVFSSACRRKKIIN